MVGEGLRRLRRILSPTFGFSERSKPVTDLSFFAALIDVGFPEYIAICTDNVGTKVLIAQMMDKYDTVGIDCVAMNVNDVVCVGATPLTVVDYLAVQEPAPDFLEAIAKGLCEGARQARVSISGGECAPVGQIIKGVRPGSGFDFSATCIGLVHKDRVIVGREVAPGDAILGLSSSGLHSNGFSLVRKLFFEDKKLTVDTYVKELGRTIGEELITPTRIYVREVLAMLDENLPMKALLNITGNGLLNLNRIVASGVGFEINSLPEPHPIFQLVQDWGDIPDEEMFRVFNMGIGFCLILPDDPAAISRAIAIAREHGVGCRRIGTVIADESRRVFVTEKALVQDGLFFVKSPGC